MSARTDSQIAYFQTADADSKTYAVQCTSGTTAYLDFTSGYYDCWSPTGSASEHFRWKYLALAATSAAGDIDAPAAATSSQTTGEATAMAPGNASPIRIYVPADKRIAILYSAAGPVTLYCTKVL